MLRVRQQHLLQLLCCCSIQLLQQPRGRDRCCFQGP